LHTGITIFLIFFDFFLIFFPEHDTAFFSKKKMVKIDMVFF